MANLAQEVQKKELLFLKKASESSLDEAIFEFGESISSREVLALKKLNPEELKQLFYLKKKIVNADFDLNDISDPLARDIVVNIGRIC